MLARPRRPARARQGFTLAELMVVSAIIGLTTYFVAQSFDSIVPRERLNTAVRNLTALLRDARSSAISRNLPFQVEYDLPRRRYRLLMPFSIENRVFREGVDDERYRAAGDWTVLPDGIEFSELLIAGVPYSGDTPYRVYFDARGSATEHLVILSQPDFESFYTVEVLALSGHFRLHDGVYRREPVDEGDFR